MPVSCVLEINDAGLTAVTAAGLQLVSPGYAVADSEGLHVGEAAYARGRLNPRRSYDRFWSRLDQQPLQRPAGDAHSNADLAYFHLGAVWQRLQESVEEQSVGEVVFAVPGDFGNERLALLLGIAQALEIPVCGLVATPVAAAATVATQAPRLYLDAELHRIAATEISGGEALRMGASRDWLKQGIAGLYDAWAGLIAERFVQETRYDPLHQAAAEQTLYQHLPEWLDRLNSQGNARLELEVGQRSHHIDVSVDDLMQAAASFYTPLVDQAAAAKGKTIVLGHRLAALPGLQTMLADRLSAPPLALGPTGVADSVFGHMDTIRSDAEAPAFVTRLPGAIADAAQAPAAPRPSAETATPTHLLFDWQAYPIHGAPLVLEPAPRGLRVGESAQHAVVALRGDQAMLEPGRDAVLLNGQAVTTASLLAVGDALSIDGESLHLIALVSGDETP